MAELPRCPYGIDAGPDQVPRERVSQIVEAKLRQSLPVEASNIGRLSRPAWLLRERLDLLRGVSAQPSFVTRLVADAAARDQAPGPGPSVAAKVANHRDPHLRRGAGFCHGESSGNQAGDVRLTPAQPTGCIGSRLSDTTELGQQRVPALGREQPGERQLPFRGRPRKSARAQRSRTCGRRGLGRHASFVSAARRNSGQPGRAPPPRRPAGGRGSLSESASMCTQQESASESSGRPSVGYRSLTTRGSTGISRL